jgi:hypothetical protein
MPETPDLDPAHAEQRERERAEEPQGGKPPTKAELTRQKEIRAAQLRVAGYEYADIARILGYANQGGAWKAVQRVRQKAVREQGRELLALELERFDTLQRAAMTKAIQGDPASIRAALRVMDQRARLVGMYRSPVDERIPDAREAFAILAGTLTARYGEPPADPQPEPDDEDEVA